MAVFYFILGLIFGSFLNAVIYRLRSKESVMIGRSHCVKCNTPLEAWDLIPLLSFAMLRGRCRYCKAKLSWQYPLIEFFTALTLVLLAATNGWKFDWLLVRNSLLAFVLIVVAVYDFKHYLILDKVIFPWVFIALFSNLLLDFSVNCSAFSLACHTTGGLFSAALISIFFFLQYLFSRGEWIGFGDVKFGVLLGLIMGWPLAIVGLFLAYVLGAVTGLSLVVAGKKHLSSRLPFGTFLGFSAIITLICGQQLAAWYLAFIGF